MRKPMDNPALYHVIGRKIAAARAANAGGPLSQSGLAKKVGLTRGSIANIEVGNQRTPVHVLWVIGQALGIEPASLIPHGAELQETARAFPFEVELEPAVKRVVEELPIARAWLSATRTKVGSAREDRVNKRRRM